METPNIDKFREMQRERKETVQRMTLPTPLAGEILTAATVEEEIARNRKNEVEKEIIMDYVKRKLEEYSQ